MANEPEMEQDPRALTLSLAQPKVGQIVDETSCSCIQSREFFMQNWWKIISHNARTTKNGPGIGSMHEMDYYLSGEYYMGLDGVLKC